jgi:hypothetical protein
MTPARGRKIAGILPPQLVIASKRNGAYAGDIQHPRWIVMSCLKVESYRRKQKSSNYGSDWRRRS